MKSSLIILFSILAVTFTGAQLPTKLDDLRGKYESAKQKALEPINKVYEQELLKLLADASSKGNLEEVDKINQELKNIGSVETSSTVSTPTLSDKSILKNFVNKKFENDFGASFEFNKDGTGIKTTGRSKSNFIWVLEQTGLVKFTGPIVIGQSDVNLFFQFKNKNEYIYGNTEDKLVFKLTLVK